MRPVRRGWWSYLRWAVVVASVLLAVGAGQVAVAQTPCCFEDNVLSLPGIELAVERYYQSVEVTGGMVAYVYRFDSETNALASLETLDADHAGGVLPDAAAIPIDALGPNTRAYTWVYEASDVASATILTVEGSDLYIVSITATTGATFDAVTLGTTTIQGMITAEAGEGLGAFDDAGYSTGGLWDKFPPGDGESPPGFVVWWDEQLYPVPEETESGEFDYGTLDGIQRAVAREYYGDTTALATPETAPVTTYFLDTFVAAFETADHAAAAMDPLLTDLRSGYAEDPSFTIEPVDPGEIGDQAEADVGTFDQDGLTYEVAVVLVQADAYVYGVVGLGIGTDTGVLETATAVVQAMIEADAGTGEETFDEDGASSGGLWDKLPAAGDAVLGGLLPETDEALYP